MTEERRQGRPARQSGPKSSEGRPGIPRIFQEMKEDICSKKKKKKKQTQAIINEENLGHDGPEKYSLNKEISEWKNRT